MYESIQIAPVGQTHGISARPSPQPGRIVSRPVIVQPRLLVPLLAGVTVALGAHLHPAARGMVGGGVANIGNMAGLGIDPESPGSSNPTNSRVSMQGGGYTPMY